MPWLRILKILKREVASLKGFGALAYIRQKNWANTRLAQDPVALKTFF
jgi:hypothetical protein